MRACEEDLFYQPLRRVTARLICATMAQGGKIESNVLIFVQKKSIECFYRKEDYETKERQDLTLFE